MLGADHATMSRFVPDGTVVIAAWATLALPSPSARSGVWAD
jgi:hypothetical protein